MRRAYVGLSAPLAYDYANPIRERSDTASDIPNPLLENVSGLLLCYDEIWFPTKALCPRDMHQLDYVKFVDEHEDLRAKAVEAVEQFRQLDPDDWGITTAPGDSYTSSIQAVLDAVPFDMRLDNHSRGTEFFSSGNAADPYLFMQDAGIARSLDLGLELTVNSRLSATAASLTELGALARIDLARLDVAQDLTLLNTVDYLGPRGAYHESIEELRAHDRLREFRQYLEAADIDDRTTADLVREANLQADRYAEQIGERYLRGRGKLYTMAKALVGPVANLVGPGLGTGAKTVITAAEWREKKSFERQVSWSLLVLNARRLARERA
jgi:hypothetical protein